MKDEKQLKYFIALNMIESANIKALNSLLRKYNKPQEIFNLSSKAVNSLPADEKRLIKKLLKNSESYLSRAEDELKKISTSEDLMIITIMDKEYPEILKNIFDPPILLYVKGSIDSLNSPAISIVGSRFCTRYGYEIASNLSYELASMGFTIVSGMAIGIDKFAHQGAIKAQGNTIAVLGSGVNYIYPHENKALYYEIIKNGAVISEFPLYTKPERYNFPRRNRIISGLSLGTIVVEARLRSGALITASFAIEQGREVFAVPGPLNNETSKGTNRLIKNGAKLVQTVDDILEEINVSQLKEIKKKTKNSEKLTSSIDVELSKEEQELLKYIDYEPKNVEEIIKSSKLKANVVERTLMMLEIKGLVTQIPGHQFRLVE